MAPQPQPRKRGGAPRDERGRFATPPKAPPAPRRRLPAADRPDPNPALPGFIVIRVVDGEPPEIDARGMDPYQVHSILEVAAHAAWSRMADAEFLDE